jgi:predicted MFS family arabinose efflux permease
MKQASAAYSVDHWIAISAASMLIGINQLIINIQPLLLGALAEGNGLDDRQLGLISSALLGGATLASASAPFWVRRVDWRRATMLFIAMAILALLATARLSSFPTLCAAFALIGLLKGAIGVPSFASLGDTQNPERNYGISVAVQAAMAAIAAVPLAAYLIPKYGPNGVYYCLIAVLVIGFWGAFRLPSKGTHGQAAGELAPISWSRGLAPFAILMIAMMSFTIGVTGFWFYLERIGHAQHVPAAMIGVAVGATALISIPGSMLATWLSRWLRGVHFVLIGSTLIVSGYLLVSLAQSTSFLSGSLIFAFGWGIAQPGYWAMATDRDPTGRLFVLSPALSGLAAALTGLIAGPIIAASGYNGLIISSGVFIAVGASFALVALRRERQKSSVGPE